MNELKVGQAQKDGWQREENHRGGDVIAESRENPREETDEGEYTPPQIKPQQKEGKKYLKAVVSDMDPQLGTYS